MSRAALILVLFIAKAAPALASEPAAELWVDAFAPASGEGTAARPYRTLERALSKLPARGGRVFVAKGLYRGPFRIPADVEIQGTSPAVLFVEGNETVVSSKGPLLLTNVSIQGGAIGLETSGRVTLDGVHLSGQRQVAVRVASGELNVSRCRFSASIADVLGIAAAPSTRVLISESSFEGPFRRAIELRSKGTLQVRDVEWQGSNIGIHQTGGKSLIRQARFISGTGPAVTVGKASCIRKAWWCSGTNTDCSQTREQSCRCTTSSRFEPSARRSRWSRREGSWMASRRLTAARSVQFSWCLPTRRFAIFGFTARSITPSRRATAGSMRATA